MTAPTTPPRDSEPAPFFPERAMAAALKNPTTSLRLLDKLDAEAHLIDFIRLLWPVIEPGRQFTDGWAVRAICEHLEAVSKGQIQSLLINVPPGTMKSLTVNVFWPAWEWGPRNQPHLKYLSAAYAETITIRDNGRTRDLLQSETYRQLWGDRVKLDPERTAASDYANLGRGRRIATSVGGMGTGERADRLIIDDPHSVEQTESEAKREGALRWYSETFSNRVNGPESATIIVMQRIHERDLSGHILSSDLGFEHLMLPMEFEEDRRCSTSIGFVDPRKEDGELLWPERFPREYVDKERKRLASWGGDYAIAGQHQQSPVPRKGAMFETANFQIIDAAPTRGRFVRGWDLASSTRKRSPFTVGVTLCLEPSGRVCITHVDRFKEEPAGVENRLKERHALDLGNIEWDFPQDPGQAGKAQKLAIARLLPGRVVTFSPETGSKEDRARPFAAAVGNGNVALVRGAWNQSYLEECRTFPAGAFKDQVDATSRAYAKLLTKRETGVAAAPEAVEADE